MRHWCGSTNANGLRSGKDVLRSSRRCENQIAYSALQPLFLPLVFQFLKRVLCSFLFGKYGLQDRFRGSAGLVCLSKQGSANSRRIRCDAQVKSTLRDTPKVGVVTLWMPLAMRYSECFAMIRAATLAPVIATALAGGSSARPLIRIKNHGPNNPLDHPRQSWRDHGSDFVMPVRSFPRKSSVGSMRH